MHPDESEAPPPRGPALADYYVRFPGPMAVAHEDLGLVPMTSWGQTGVGSIVSSLEAIYEPGNRYLLAVKTIRSRDGLDPRGLPIESPAIALSNFLSRTEVTTDPDRYRYTADQPSPDPATRRERYLRIQQATNQAAPSPVTVPCDGIPVAGTRITALDHAVLELLWGTQTIQCTGVPEIIDRLTLRTATTHDIATVDT